MNQHPLDLARYASAAPEIPAVALDAEQVSELDGRARRYRDQYRSHLGLHNAITTVVIGGILALDIGLVAVAGRSSSAVVAIAVASAAHGFLTYSGTIYTMHEGAGHNLLYGGRGRRAKWMNRLANQTCRLFFADPDYYAAVHPTHHALLATQGDMAYTHYVAPERFARSLLPLAGLLPFNDYLIHTDHSFSPSHRKTLAVGIAYHALLAVLLFPAVGILGVLAVLVVLAPWLAFTLDRVRETYDHLFTTTDRRWGARSLGVGVAGMVFGGGPWGQPCHLAHHFAPGLPWYQQLRLHLDFRRVLRPDQRRALLTPTPLHFPRTYVRNIAMARRSSRLVTD